MEYLSAFGAVCVEGPKWCGKTWTCENISKSVYEVGNPAGNFQNRKLAEMNPSAILEGETPRLIDEWQEVPSLWDAVRYSVDQKPGTGHYLLTGSSTPKYKGILHSGAGRIARLKMNTMTLYESGDSNGVVSLSKLIEQSPEAVLTGEVTLETLANLIIDGGWPGQFRLKERKNANLLAKDYINAIINNDLNRLEDKQRDIEKMRGLLRSLARNESTTASIRVLRRDMENVDGRGMDEDTIADYLNALQRLFVIEDQPPFSSNIRSSIRIKQSAKRHFTDPSIAAALLGMTSDSMIGDLKTFGFLFEALCERDLKVYAESIGAKLYHYQDYRNREIDAVIEYADGRWAAFEIKLGANQIDNAAKGLLKLKKEFDDEPSGQGPSYLCVICGLSNAVYTREDGVIVVPITSLKN